MHMWPTHMCATYVWPCKPARFGISRAAQAHVGLEAWHIRGPVRAVSVDDIHFGVIYPLPLSNRRPEQAGQDGGIRLVAGQARPWGRLQRRDGVCKDGEAGRIGPHLRLLDDLVARVAAYSGSGGCVL